MIRRLLASLTLIGGLMVSTAGIAHAQADPAATAAAAEGGSGDPLYGYLAFAALAGLFLAILCRSSRRS